MRAPAELKKWREAEGLSQGEAGKRIDVSQPSWSDYEAGRKTPRTKLALKIADLTKGAVSVDMWAEDETGVTPAEPGTGTHAGGE